MCCQSTANIDLTESPECHGGGGVGGVLSEKRESSSMRGIVTLKTAVSRAMKFQMAFLALCMG